MHKSAKKGGMRFEKKNKGDAHSVVELPAFPFCLVLIFSCTNVEPGVRG